MVIVGRYSASLKERRENRGPRATQIQELPRFQHGHGNEPI